MLKASLSRLRNVLFTYAFSKRLWNCDVIKGDVKAIDECKYGSIFSNTLVVKPSGKKKNSLIVPICYS